jgi:hypothetical protein
VRGLKDDAPDHPVEPAAHRLIVSECSDFDAPSGSMVLQFGNELSTFTVAVPGFSYGGLMGLESRDPIGSPFGSGVAQQLFVEADTLLWLGFGGLALLHATLLRQIIERLSRPDRLAHAAEGHAFVRRIVESLRR